MKNYAKVMIETKGLSSLQESISIGKQVMERKLAAYQKKQHNLNRLKEWIPKLLSCRLIKENSVTTKNGWNGIILQMLQIY